MAPEPSFGLADYLDPEHFYWEHDCNTPALDRTRRHRGVLPLGANGWTLIQPEPLTVQPSIHCLRCGTHGFITNGKWVSV